MRKIGTVLAGLSLAASSAFGAPTVTAAGNGSCAEAIDVAVWHFGYRRSTLSCNGAVRSNTWRVRHTNGCYTDITFYNSGDIGGGTVC